MQLLIRFAGLSFCDISTGEFFVFEIPINQLGDQIESINPSEFLIPKRDKEFLGKLIERINPQLRITKLDDWIFNFDFANELLKNQFKTVTLKGFGIDKSTAGIIAAGAVLNYLNETQRVNLSHLNRIQVYNPSDYMILDHSTKRNLEIVFSMQDGSREGSLISILDKTQTAMGGRLLKKWISAPLRDLDPIKKRHDSVEELLKNKKVRKDLNESLKQIGDFERLISRICTGRATPREVVAMKSSLKILPEIKQVLSKLKVPTLKNISEQLNPLVDIVEKISTAIIDSPPAAVNEGGIIRNGFSPELDELRDISLHGKEWIATLQQNERERTGISSLKVNFNNVFGYYIDVSNAHKTKVPDNYIRKQTLVNSERYITPELKEYEDKILNAQEKINELESQLFNEIRAIVANEVDAIQNNARVIAMLDCLNSFAQCAEEYDYVKPTINESNKIIIIEGRHPVVERILDPGEQIHSK